MQITQLEMGVNREQRFIHCLVLLPSQFGRKCQRMAKAKPVVEDLAIDPALECFAWAGEAAEALTGADPEVDAKVREAVIAGSDFISSQAGITRPSSTSAGPPTCPLGSMVI